VQGSFIKSLHFKKAYPSAEWQTSQCAPDSADLANLGAKEMPKSELADLELIYKYETEKVYLVVSETTGKEAWLPKSIVEYDGEKTFTLPEWLVEITELI